MNDLYNKQMEFEQSKTWITSDEEIKTVTHDKYTDPATDTVILLPERITVTACTTSQTV